MEWHHFPWQLRESNQQGGQCRLGARAKPCSLSTCLLKTASQLAVFAFQVCGEFMKSVFFKLCLFSLLLSLSSCGSRLLEWKVYALSWSQTPLGLRKMMLVWNDRHNKTGSLHRSASMRTHHRRVSAEVCEDEGTTFELAICISKLAGFHVDVERKVDSFMSRLTEHLPPTILKAESTFKTFFQAKMANILSYQIIHSEDLLHFCSTCHSQNKHRQ